jgi:methyl-accepting chemotaxis protein
VDLNVAIQKHAQWKFRFHQAMLEKQQMDAASISKDNNCELGKWLHGEAKALHKHCKAYAKCVTGHAAFHVEAGKVAVVVNAQRKEEAERMLGADSAYTAASKQVSVALIELQNEMAR